MFWSISESVAFFWADAIADMIINLSRLSLNLLKSTLQFLGKKLCYSNIEVGTFFSENHFLFPVNKLDKSWEHTVTQIILLIIQCCRSSDIMVICIFLWLYNLLFHLSDIAVTLYVCERGLYFRHRTHEPHVIYTGVNLRWLQLPCYSYYHEIIRRCQCLSACSLYTLRMDK